jgi:hypothetical protein
MTYTKLESRIHPRMTEGFQVTTLDECSVLQHLENKIKPPDLRPDLTCGTPDLRPDLTCVFPGTPDLRPDLT